MPGQRLAEVSGLLLFGRLWKQLWTMGSRSSRLLATKLLVLHGIMCYAVLPYEGALATNGIVLQQTGPPESLPKAALRKIGSVSVEDLERLCLHYNLIDAGFGGLFRESSYDAVWDWSRPSHSVLMSDRWVWNRPSRWVLESSVWVWNRLSHQFLGSYI